MQMDANRRRRLRALIDERFGGSQARFAAKVQRQSGYVARVLNGNRGFGEHLARQIELIVGLPIGWLDADDGAMFSDPTIHELLRRIKSLPQNKARLLAEMIRPILDAIEYGNVDRDAAEPSFAQRGANANNKTNQP